MSAPPPDQRGAGGDGDAAARPNVLVILADQLRRCALSCYGDPNVATPAIDSLADAGARFANASATYPVCVPSRFTLMTGEYAHTRFIPAIEWRMSPAERTLADEFNEAGYDTAYFGKWHLHGGGGDLPGHTVVESSRTAIPRRFQGRWQQFTGFEVCNNPFDTYYFTDNDPIPHRIDGFQTDVLFDMAIDYLRQPERRPNPFAAVVSVEPPHPLFTAPQQYLDRWRGRRLTVRENVELANDYNTRGPHSHDLLDDLRIYYGMIENLDDNVGRIVAALGDHDLIDNTVIVVMSDHGELLGSHGLLSKQQPYEESVGIPLIVAGPTTQGREGAVIGDPVCMEDLFPTLLGLAGLRPRDPKPGLDLTPLIRGDVDGLERDGVLLEFVAELRPNMPFHDQTWRGLRTRHGKYTVLGDAHGGRPWQYFDLGNDPYELTNLIDDPGYLDEIRRHHRLLRARLAEIDDHYVLKPAYDCDGLNEWDPDAKFQRR